jgi:microcystin-dependent protein
VSSPFVAEIRIFACNFAPVGWAKCNGQLMAISQNTALFALLGTFYGGDGKSTFALPNIQGSATMAWGQGSGLSLRQLGEMSGTPQVTLLESEIPAHSHIMQATASPATTSVVSSGVSALARSAGGSAYKASPGAAVTNMAFQTLSIAGSSFPHNNLMPYLVLNYCIALQGVFPPRG